METKQYQKISLGWLARYYRRCRALLEAGDSFPAATAFTSVTAEIYEGAGLPYSPVKQVPGIPYVCLRLPTGGGKTFVACEAVALGIRELLQKDRALVLWLVPSDAIRSQTITRLKDSADPYRQALDSTLGNVAVLDIEEALHINRALLDSYTVIVVATMQAFRRKNMDALNVYKNNGSLMGHFENLPSELKDLLDMDDEGHYPLSLVNVFRMRRPFVVMDEAHNARQPLSFETLRRLNPSAVIEFTATPNLKAQTLKEGGETIENPPSNVLHSTSAFALKAEEMIKLPIYLRCREPWDALLGDAIGFLKHLDTEARIEEAATGEYIRPIMLLQAQPEYKDKASITVETIESKLLEFGIPPEEICVHTGDRRGLDGVDVLTKSSRARFIITVQALKEGWDCPWAYALYSVAELSSKQAVEQILGRILRMPRAKRKGREDLNCAYAFVASTKFGEAAQALTDGLIASGFNQQDAAELVVERPLIEIDTDETAQFPNNPVTVTLPEIPKASIPVSVMTAVDWEPTTGEFTILEPLNAEQERDISEWAGCESARSVVRQAIDKRAGRAGTNSSSRCPADRGVAFSVPVLSIKQGDFFHQFEEDDLLEHNNWTLANSDADLPGFILPSENRGLVIDIEKNLATAHEKIQSRFLAETDRQQSLFEVSAGWSAARLIVAIARSFPHPGLTDAEIDLWLQRVITALEDRGITLEQMTAHRHRLYKAVADQVKQLEKGSLQNAYETLLFGKSLSQTVYVSLSSTIEFLPNQYPVNERYNGLHLPKHFYKEIGAMNSEELQCAQLLAHAPQVATWVRNLERQPRFSFWLQTHADKFYPDFVAKLDNGKILAIEYKGAHLADTADTREKERLGKLWQERSGGLCYFEMIRGLGELSKIQDTLKKIK